MIKRELIPQPRLLQLESLLLWEGRLNNSRLRELFDIKEVRASEWIRAFREFRPGWCEWSGSTKSYHATQRAYDDGSSAGKNNYAIISSLTQYLALTGTPHTTFESTSGAKTVSAFPDISAPSPRIYATISEAIRTRSGVRITYMSMREPKPHPRTIYPHSLVQAGRRWHTRAFSVESGQFRDFALGRMVFAEPINSTADIDIQSDEAWVTDVKIRLIAHPDLSRDHEKMIRHEYFRGTSARVDTCRAALVNYYVQDIRAALNVETQKPPEYQLAVSNIEEVGVWLFPQK